MAQPINYLGMMPPPPDIGRSLLSGLQAGSTFREMEQLRIAQQQAEQVRQQYAADLQATFSNPTPQAFAALSAKYPQQREAFKQSWDMLNKDQQDSEFVSGAQAFNALNAGNVPAAKSLLEQRISAMANAGQDTRKLQSMRDALEGGDVKAVQANLGFVLSAVDPDRWDKMTKTAASAEMRPLEAEEKRAGIANIRSQIQDRAARLRLDADKLTSDVELKLQEFEQTAGKLPESAQKLVNDAVVASVAGETAAASMTDLADKFEREGGGYGGISRFSEFAARATGRQDYMTELRNQYARIRNSAALRNLPPGPATDKDIEVAREGMPDENADAAYIASFLRGTAKIERLNAQLEDAKAQWIGDNGTLGKARRDVEIGGVRVPAGTTFNEFQRQFAKARAGGMEAQQAQTPGGAVQQLFQKYSTPAGR